MVDLGPEVSLGLNARNPLCHKVLYLKGQRKVSPLNFCTFLFLLIGMEFDSFTPCSKGCLSNKEREWCSFTSEGSMGTDLGVSSLLLNLLVSILILYYRLSLTHFRVIPDLCGHLQE